MFQDLSAKAAARGQVIPSGASAAQQMADLVDRYPNLSEVELARLINLYGQVSALDLALMISDEKLAPRLDRFFKDHRSKVRTPFRQYAALVVTAAVGAAILVWAVAFG